MKWGRSSEKGIYREFLEAIEKAEAQAKVRNVTIIQAAAKDNWQAAAYWLERRYPEEWGRRGRFLNKAEETD